MLVLSRVRSLVHLVFASAFFCRRALFFRGQGAFGAGRTCRIERVEIFLGHHALGLSREDGHAVGNRDLVIVGVDFGKREKSLSVAAVFDEGGLKGRLYSRDLGEVDIAFERPLGGRFEIELFNLVTV